MKALSILQPWAWLIVNSHKDIENRNWATKFRGRFIVHAGKKWGREQREDLEYVREQFQGIAFPDRFDLGGIVGAATLVDCVTSSTSPWFFGRFGFVLKDAAALKDVAMEGIAEFVPWKGQLGFFDIPRAALIGARQAPNKEVQQCQS